MKGQRVTQLQTYNGDFQMIFKNLKFKMPEIEI